MTEKDDIVEILDLYGLERILEDNYIDLPDAISILEELGFVCLEMYLKEE